MTTCPNCRGPLEPERCSGKPVGYCPTCRLVVDDLAPTPTLPARKDIDE